MPVCRYDAEDVYIEMWRNFNEDENFHDDKYPGKLPKDWYLFRNFKIELYGKEVRNIIDFYMILLLNRQKYRLLL